MGLRERSGIRIFSPWVLAALALLAAAGPAAAAAPKPITGTLSETGYTVVALAKNGQVTSVRATRRRVQAAAAGGACDPPPEDGERDLRRPDRGPPGAGREACDPGRQGGCQAGPDQSSRGLRGGLSKRLAAGVDRRESTGAGQERRSHRRRRLRARSLAGPSRGAVSGDLDLDGIPDPLDIDDDGDRVLDTLDRSTRRPRARAAQGGGCGPGEHLLPAVSSVLNVYFKQDSANANAGSTTDEIDAGSCGRAGVTQVRFRGGRPTDRGFDCAGDPAGGTRRAGLRYCSRAGTGIASAGDPAGAPFPGTPDAPPGKRFDGDGDGFGVLDPELEPVACGGWLPGQLLPPRRRKGPEGTSKQRSVISGEIRLGRPVPRARRHGRRYESVPGRDERRLRLVHDHAGLRVRHTSHTPELQRHRRPLRDRDVPAPRHGLSSRPGCPPSVPGAPEGTGSPSRRDPTARSG